MTNDLRNRLNKVIDDHNLNIGHAQPYELKDQSYFRVIDAILAKLNHDALAHPVRVKPLVWSNSGIESSATTQFGYYLIANCHEEGFGFWGVGADIEEYPNIGYFETIEAAKTHAQADYEARIRAALEPDEATDPDALIVAALEAAADSIEKKHTNNLGMIHPEARLDAASIRALAADPEARAAIKQKSRWSE